MRSVTFFAFLFCLTFNFIAQTVTRGPYMQMPTDNSIIVMWRTSSAANSRVVYGTSAGNLNMTASSASNVTDHKITLTGLQPYTKYYYAVGNSTTILAGGTTAHSFVTHPVPGTELPIRIWSIGDFGKANTGQLDVKNSYMNYVDTNLTNVWLWLGDNAYDDGKDADYQNNVFGYTGFSDVFSGIPFYPSPGNHDYNEVWSQSVLFGIPYSNIPLTSHQGPYYDIVEVPQQAEAGGAPSNLEVFYSFDYGNVHFLSLNSEVYDFSGTLNGVNAMKAWITQDLQQNTKPFTIAYFHQPPYTKGSHDSDSPIELVMKTMREEVVPLLESFDVDIILCGHSHVYERSWLMKNHYGNSSSFNATTMIVDTSNGNLAQGHPYIKDSTNSTHDGTIYVVCGNGGSSEAGAPLNHPAYRYTEGGSCGSFIMEVYKNRLDGKYLNISGNITDHFTLLKKNLLLTPFSNQTICLGDTLIMQAVFTGGSDSLSFTWTNSGSDSASAVLNPTANTSYTLTVTDLLTGQSQSTSFAINVLSVPAPVVTQSNDTLYAQPGYTYQWYLNGVPVSGATGYFIVPTVNGNYSVEIFNGPCSLTSSSFNFTTSGIVVLEEENILVYPNPNQGVLRIEINNETEWEELILMDALGRIIGQRKPVHRKMKWDMTELPAGNYFLVFRSKTGSAYKQIIKN
ncbi:MAG: metallophosphoesterase [Bacteroidia bacterium]|nr:metallophosphoesterase [Bacteroidia bacterium]